MRLAASIIAIGVALGLAACSGEQKPPETPVADTPAVTPAADPGPAPTATADIGATPADPAAYMHDRHERYEDLGKHFKTLNDNSKAAAPDMPAVTAAAAKVKEYADAMGTWFPAGTGPETAKTRAKAEIWTDRATFNTRWEALKTETAKLAAATTDAAAFKTAFGEFAKSGACKNCHDTFRTPEENH